MEYTYNILIILLIPLAFVVLIAVLVLISDKYFGNLYLENDTTYYQKSTLSDKIINIKTLFSTPRTPREPPRACFFGRFGGEEKHLVGEVEPNYLDYYDRKCWDRRKLEEAYKQALSNNKKENIGIQGYRAETKNL
jgi:hypothetical protein